MTRAALVSLMVVMLAALASPATARVGHDPVKVSLVRGAKPAPGEPQQDILRIEAAAAVSLNGLVLEGPGWRVNAAGLPRALDLAAGEVVEIPFTAASANAAVPIQLRWRREGVDRRRAFDLSPESRLRNTPDPATIYRTLDDARAGRSRDFPNAEIRNPRVELDVTPLPGKAGAGGPAGSSSGTIGVSGIVVCEHERTGELVPAGNIFIRATASTYLGPSITVTTRTREDGFFQVDFEWTHPDPAVVSIIIKAGNGEALVEDATWEDDYTFGAMVYGAEPGNIYGLGYVAPTDSDTKGAFYIAETIRRGALHLEALGYPTSFVEVQWPDTDGSLYNDYWEEIHLAPGDGFNEATILHEYGHRWNHSNANYPDFDYCNGECDDEIEWWFDDCGHCMWCEEDATVAWLEGIAQIISRICTDHIKITYPVPEPDSLWVKAIQTTGDASDCADPNPDPSRTEGPFAALMYDLFDTQDFGEDDPAYPGYHDVLGGNRASVLEVLTSDPVGACGGRPNTPDSFLACYLASYPQYHEDIWETAMNNGFDCDTEAPDVVTELTGVPAPGHPFPDATVRISWRRAGDDASGVAGYAFELSPGAPATPGFVKNLSDVTAYATPPLTPGDWYFSIRTVDRAGRWSPDYAVAGPFQLEAIVSADLAAIDRTGWDFPLVPRNDTGATGLVAEVTANLDGNDNNTYWSISAANTGTALSPSAQVAVYVDDEILDERLLGSVAGGTSRYLTNKGPITVDAGRHFMGMFLDSDETFSEADEFDNYWAGQWVWRSDLVGSAQSQDFPAPPHPLAGINYFNFMQPYAANCRGARIDATTVFHGIWMSSIDGSEDYDLKLFDLNELSEEGYLSPLATSQQGPYKLEAVFAHGYLAGLDDFTVGVYNTLGDNIGSGDYRVRRVVATALPYFGTYQDTLSDVKMLDLYTFGSLTGTDGWVTLHLDRVGTTPVTMAFFGHDVIHAGLADADEYRWIRQDYPTEMTVQIPPGETGGLAIWIDRAELSGPVPYTLTFDAALPDPSAFKPWLWASHVVPRPEDDIPWPFDEVPAPASLPSEPDSTWFYFSEKNASPITCPLHEVTVYLDGEVFFPLVGPELAGGAWRGSVGWTGVPVRGGRHTVGMVVDPNETLIEEIEDNNQGGAQWVWEPVPLAWDSSLVEDAPPPCTGGWSDLPENPPFLNCLGYETPDLALSLNRALVAYIMPAGASNYDLRLHPHSTGSQEGFGQHLANSNYSDGEADFIVFGPISEASPFTYDLGVVGLSGTRDFVVQVDRSDNRSLAGAGTYPGIALPADDMVNIHRINMDQGAWTFSVVSRAKDPVDLGISLHPYGEMTSRADALAWADGYGEGDPESISLTLAGPQTYALAIWRAGSADRLTSTSYTITVEADLTGVGDGTAPVATRILPASPNPFTGATSIAFETVEEGEVTLSVFDMQGRRLRVLREGYLPAGRHEATWNGRDDGGSPVASGIYFIRLRTAEEQAVMKVVRME